MKATIIPVPTYIMDDEQLLELADRLHGFAAGDPDVRDDEGPCERAVAAVEAIKDELHYRGSTFSLNKDGSITATSPKPIADI